VPDLVHANKEQAQPENELAKDVHPTFSLTGGSAKSSCEYGGAGGDVKVKAKVNFLALSANRELA
jgi:hypothetical protein